MNSPFVTALVLGLTASLAGAATQTADFGRYQTIIERSPFGAMQIGTGATAPNWSARFQYVGNTVSNSGNGPVQAILFDKELNRSYFRAEGETIDNNVTVVKIELDQRQPKVVLKTGLETATLTFPERSASANVPGMQPSPNVPQAPGGAPPPTIRRIPFRRGN